jgi:ribosomal protein L11 methyltransferase
VPYRIDIRNAGPEALDRLIELGAMDVDLSQDAAVSALMPDNIPPEQVASALGAVDVSVSPATSRDGGSVWILRPRATRIRGLQIVPASIDAEPNALQLADAAAFGTGLHPTTALCLEAIDDSVRLTLPAAMLDVGTGSGVLALGALKMGVPRALGVDLDQEALGVAAENARINGLSERLELIHGGPDAAPGAWPLVVANIQAGPLIEMAPILVRRAGHQGHLVLCGIPESAWGEVDRAYRHLGMRRVGVNSRTGWVALVLQASW